MGLNYLVIYRYEFPGIFVLYGVFENTGERCAKQCVKEIAVVHHQFISKRIVYQPAHPAIGKAGTVGVEYPEIPTIVKVFQNIILNVLVPTF